MKFLVLTQPNEDGLERVERAAKYLADMLKVPRDPSNLSLEPVAVTVRTLSWYLYLLVL